MARVEIFEVEMPDGSVINAEVSVADSIADVGIQEQLRIGRAKEPIESFVRWVIDGLGFAARDDDIHQGLEPSASGMRLGRLGLEFGLKLVLKTGALTSVLASAGGEATAIVRLEWERTPGGD